jgi:hydrogenase-4 component F
MRQANYKRMLAYSSVEHMGVLAIGCGLGQAATYGAILHLLGASLCKAMLFLVAGNVLLEYRSKRITDVSGLLRRLPASGALLLAGILVLTGAPPFPLFLSELALLRGALQAGQPWVGASLVLLQVVVFIGLGVRLVAMVQGGPGGAGARPRESVWLIAPPAALLAVALAVGVVPAVHDVLQAAAATLGGSRP